MPPNNKINGVNGIKIIYDLSYASILRYFAVNNVINAVINRVKHINDNCITANKLI